MDIHQRKVFVGGLSWMTTTAQLTQYFSQFGTVTECEVVSDRNTGRSRGFGFVSFADTNTVDAVLQHQPHQLNTRTVDVKRIDPSARPKVIFGTHTHRIFLGGLPHTVTETELRLMFQQFGAIKDVVIVVKDDRRLTGIGFVSFEESSVAEGLIAKRFLCINGKQVEVKRARPRDPAYLFPAPLMATSEYTAAAVGTEEDLISFSKNDDEDESSSDEGSVVTVIENFRLCTSD